MLRRIVVVVIVAVALAWACAFTQRVPASGSPRFILSSQEGVGHGMGVYTLTDLATGRSYLIVRRYWSIAVTGMPNE